MYLQNIPTPYYLFDEKECVDRFKKIQSEIKAWSGKACYAIKANPFLIPSLLSLVDKLEVCSPGELEICRKYQVPGEKIIFSGVVKTKEDIKAAIDYPVDTITLESMTHWTYLKQCLSEDNQIRSVRILPRLTSGAQFGMSFENICIIANEQKSMDNVSFEGLHFFTGTQKKGRKYEKELLEVQEKMTALKEILGDKDIYLEYGPGLAVPYFEGDDFEASLTLVTELKEFILENNFDYRIDVELGRYFAASCGSYHTSVVDLKKAEDRYYCLVDGGINHVNYYGQNMAMRTPIIKHISCKTDDESAADENIDGDLKGYSGYLADFAGEHEYMICGSLCTFADILVRGKKLTDLNIGDELVFENIGAYSVTESSYLFLSRKLPGIYLRKCDGSIVKLRDNSETYPINSYEEI